MTLISGRVKALALKHMPQMTTAVGTYNLSSCHAKGAVLMTDNSAGDAVKVGWPAAARLELVSSLVERRITSCASVDAFVRIVLIELS